MIRSRLEHVLDLLANVIADVLTKHLIELRSLVRREHVALFVRLDNIKGLPLDGHLSNRVVSSHQIPPLQWKTGKFPATLYLTIYTSICQPTVTQIFLVVYDVLFLASFSFRAFSQRSENFFIFSLSLSSALKP